MKFFKHKRLVLSLAVGLGVLIAGYLLVYYRDIKAALSVESDPKAEVFVNDQKIGETPINVERKPGQIKLKLIPTDGALSPYETSLSLTPQVKTIVRHKFSVSNTTSDTEQISFEKEDPSRTFLSVVTKPIGSQISIDNAIVGVSPQKLDITEGPHSIHLFLPGYLEKDINIQTIRGYNLTLYVEIPFAINTPPLSKDVSLGNFVILPAPSSKVTVLKDASFGSISIGSIKSGQIVKGLARDEKNVWLKVQLDTLSGWIPLKYASVSGETSL